MTPRDRAYAAGAAVAVLAGLIAGFLMLGSPVDQRGVQADSRRVTDLQSIARFLHSQSPSPLPRSLAQVVPPKADPVTGRQYEYQRIDDHRYQLCATFTADNRNLPDPWPDPFWRHPAGRHCFDLNDWRIPPN